MKLTTLRHKPPIRCKVEIMTHNGKRHVYDGLFKTTADAVMDALDRFGFGRVSVRRTA